MNTEQKIIENLLSIISQLGEKYGFQERILFTDIHNQTDMSIYSLVIKGEKDKGTPFYCASTTTHVAKEDYCEGDLVYASIEYDERSFQSEE
jgi:hypothetical protein